MKKFWVVFKHEFLNQVKSKAYIITTVLFVVALFAGSFFLGKKVNGMQNDEATHDVEELETVNVYLKDESLKDYADSLATYGYEVKYFNNEEDLKNAITEEESSGIIINGFDNIERIFFHYALGDEFDPLNDVLNLNYKNKLLQDLGLSSEDVLAVNTSSLEVNTSSLDASNDISVGVGLAFTMFLYLALILFGGIISSSVISEKTSKAMEVLITSAKPESLVAGKVLGVGSAYLMQLLIVLAGAFISAKINLKNIFEMFPIEEAFHDVMSFIPFGLFLVIVGFFTYLFLFAAFSSFTSKPEDANTAITPIMIIIIVIFFVTFSGMGSNIFNTKIMRVLSYVPLASPFFLFARYVMYGLSSAQIILGITTNLLGLVFFIWLSSKIYRAGTMYYGNKLSIKTMYKQIMHQ